MLLRREETAAKIARRYRISEATLGRYRDAFLEGGLKALQDGNRDSVEDQNKELRKQLALRDQVIGELPIANRIQNRLPGVSQVPSSSNPLKFLTLDSLQ